MLLTCEHDDFITNYCAHENFSGTKTTLTSSSEMNKQTFTQLNGPSTGNGGGTNFGKRCLRGLTNNGAVFWL